jgi:hypothetical protein
MDSDHEDIIKRMRDLVEHLRPKAEALREEGDGLIVAAPTSELTLCGTWGNFTA